MTTSGYPSPPLGFLCHPTPKDFLALNPQPLIEAKIFAAAPPLAAHTPWGCGAAFSQKSRAYPPNQEKPRKRRGDGGTHIRYPIRYPPKYCYKIQYRLYTARARLLPRVLPRPRRVKDFLGRGSRRAVQWARSQGSGAGGVRTGGGAGEHSVPTARTGGHPRVGRVAPSVGGRPAPLLGDRP